MSSIEQTLIRGSAELGVQLTVEQRGLLLRYLDLLVNWNKRINLVGSRDEQNIVMQHLVDSLAVLRHIPGDLERLIDVGSGAGLPGAVIAMMRPEIQVTALEPIHKKHAFLQAIRREIPLPSFHPLAERLDAHCSSPTFRPYDVAISRATFALPEWLLQAHSVVRNGGLILAMEGAEKQDLPEGAMRHPYKLGNRTRAIISQRPAPY